LQPALCLEYSWPALGRSFTSSQPFGWTSFWPWSLPLFNPMAWHTAMLGRGCPFRPWCVRAAYSCDSLLRVCPTPRVLAEHIRYCWRGGMRSASTGWLLSLCGFDARVLDGGYRSYRRWCTALVGDPATPPPTRVVVLGGCTGSGKTDVLSALSARGEQVIDLEGLANHRGSAFGSVGQQPQPSNEAYENEIALAVRRASPDRPLWLEHEGQHVGCCSVPHAVQTWVRCASRGVFVVMGMPRELRALRLVEDYCRCVCVCVCVCV
jgi:tRNA 2-selenouridine synthase